MTRNQKLALGCGGLGCLALILIVVVCVILGVAGYISIPGVSSNRNNNDNSNSNSNYNSNLNSNTNTNTSSDSSSSSSLSDDDKHKLVQAAGFTQDTELIQRVLRKLGFLTADNQVSSDYAPFLKAHADWARRNYRFIQSVNTIEKARAYVEAHIND